MAASDQVLTGEPNTVVLVEGVSDQRAVELLARRSGRDLAADGVQVLAMGGATNIGHYLERYGPHGTDVGVAGLCDRAEMSFFRIALDRAGVGTVADAAGMARFRFFVCDSDLEDELIRALGTDVVLEILREHGDLGSFEILRQQPAQRGWSDAKLLQRFMGTRGGRKIHYATILSGALDLDRLPDPLDRLLASV